MAALDHPLYLTGFSQVAYVTNDIDQAMAEFGETFGVRDFLVRRGNPMAVETTMDLALAYVGPTMLEVIQARGAGGHIYDVGLPADGFALRFHHIGHVVETEEDWQRLRAAVAEQAIPIALDDTMVGSRASATPFIYLDTRKQLGHIVEYSLMSPARRALYADIPRN